jgi:hypothetical protein
MVAAERDERTPRGRGAHPEEWLSMLIAFGITVASVAFFWLQPTFQPAGGFAWTIPGWIAFAYLFSQILFLLVSATQIRALGVLDSIIAIFPFVAGLVLVAEWVLGRLPFSLYQLNALAVLLTTGLAEFLLTVWIRFVVNRRTISIDAG